MNNSYTKLDQINQASTWHQNNGPIFSSNSISTEFYFYPMYKLENLASYSIFELIKNKGYIRLNSSFLNKKASFGDVSLPNPTIDAEIERIGGPTIFSKKIHNRHQFIQEFVEAFNQDIDLIENSNPDKTNIVLCGGKDSLNLLLRQWKNETIAFSAEPNYDLVKQFIVQNNLDIRLYLLKDIDPEEQIDHEVAEASCLVDLRHWRWTQHLKEISNDFGTKCVFWKGQVADAFLTDYWRTYTSSTNRFYKLAKRAYRKTHHNFPKTINEKLTPFLIEDLSKSVWERAAVAQGAHLGFLRAICGALFLSAYHGQRCYEVIKSMDFASLADVDLRPQIGEKLLGREVWYPPINPAPPPSAFRSNTNSVDAYLNSIAKLGIKIKQA